MKNKKYLLLILVFILAFTLFACDKNNKDPEQDYTYTHPEITEKNTNVITSPYTVTKADVNTMLRYYGGIGLLLQQLDEHLLSSEIAAMTTTDPLYVSRLSRLIYSTDDVASLTAEEKTELETSYDYTMKVMGFFSEADRVSYTKLLAARDQYAITYLIDVCQADETNSYYLSEEILEAYYNYSALKDDSKAIVIDFDSRNDFYSILKSLGLVIYNSELRLYTDPAVSINDVKEINLSNDNTRVLTTEEAKAKFIALYNAVYSSYKEALPTDASLDTLASLSYNLQNLYNVNSELSTKIASMDQDNYTYMVKPYAIDYGTAYTLVYKLSSDKAFEDLSEVEVQNLKEEYYSELVKNTSVVTEALVYLRKNKGLSFNDRFFAQDYANSYDTAYAYLKLVGNSSVIVSLADGFDITADEYYSYGTNRNLPYYLIYASIKAIEESTASFALLYGNEKDLLKNASMRKVEYYDLIEQALSTQATDTTKYALEEDFIYKTYGFTNKEDALYHYLIVNDLKTILVKDLLFSLDDETLTIAPAYQAKVEAVIDDLYDNYYDLYTYELAIYTDYNSDYKKDSTLDVVNNIENYAFIDLYDDANVLLSDHTLRREAYTKALNDLYTLINDKVKLAADEDEAIKIMKDFIKEYNLSSRIDGSYAKYKKLGFKLAYRALSTTASSSSTTKISITYANYKAKTTTELNKAYTALFNDISDGTYDKYVISTASDFTLTSDIALDASKTYYTEVGASYSKVETPDVEDIATYYEKSGMEFVLDDSGAHFIVAKAGDKGKTKPSYKYENAVSDTSDNYNDMSENANSKPSISQICGALDLSFYKIIATDSTTAKNSYNIKDFPKAYPTSLDLSTYTSVLESYFYNNNFVNAYFSSLLKANESYSSVYTDYEAIFTYFLNQE